MHSDSLEAQRLFIMPCLPWLPLGAIVSNNFIVANLPAPALLRFVVLEMMIGSLIYHFGVRPRQGAPREAGVEPVTLGSRAYAGFSDEGAPAAAERVEAKSRAASRD